MARYAIIWNIGYGEMWDEVEAETAEKADLAAYEAAREDFEGSAEYRAVLMTKSVAENYGFDWEDDE